MKKVLFTATVDSHILQFHIPYLKLFKENGYEVHVATNGNKEIPYCDVKHVIPFERSPIKINNLRAIKQLKQIIEDEEFDIIHCHTPMGATVTRLAAKEARKKGTRVIYTAHGFHFYKGAPVKNWVIFYLVEKFLAKYTDTLILINQEDYRLAQSKFSRRCKDIQYVPGVGIDEKKFDFVMRKEEKSRLKESIGLDDKDFVIIYPAEISKRKRQEWLIDSISGLLKEYKEIKMLLPGKDSLNGKCQEIVKRKGLEQQIKFLGYRKDIPRLLKISDLSISTANQEGLPVNIMEAMYIGLPIVASNCRGNRDLVFNNKNGFLIELEDSNGFNKALLELKNNSKLYNKMSLENKELIKPYMLEEVMRDMEKIYFEKKRIAFLRSTAIFNDSRATKEIESYNKNNNQVLVYGWNRQLENINFSDNRLNEYKLLDLKANYGSGIKNIFRIIRFNFWLKRQLEKNINKIDIIHACDFDTALMAKYIAKKYNKKLIYDIYDYYADCHNLGILKPLVEKEDIKIINFADYVLLCTEKRIEQISKSKPRNVAIIHNSPYNMDKISGKQHNNDKINVGYFGILQDDRLLIEISNEIIKNKNIVFHIGGFGKYEKYFEDLAKQYSNVIYYGTLKYEDVLKNEMKCDVLFATYNPNIENHKYSAPNKVYEAMALNIPIIVCNNTGIDEMVIKEKLGEAINYDAKEFITAITKLKDRKEITSAEVFEKKYSWQVMEQRLNKIISGLREKFIH